MNPLVSVIIPAYNAEKTITDCLESVRQQTYKNIEIIVINDGSTDNTLSIVEQYKVLYNDFNLKIYTITNSGPASARNCGIDHANGEYIAFLDSDDRWISTKLEKQIKCLLNHPDIKMLGCNYSIGKNKYSNKGGVRIISKDLLLFKNYFITPTIILSKNLLNDYRFENGRKYSEDYRLWLQIAFAGHRCALLWESLVTLCDKPMYGASGLSSKLWLMEKGELSNYEALYSGKLIPFWKYLAASIFSYSKYVKRLFVTFLRTTKGTI